MTCFVGIGLGLLCVMTPMCVVTCIKHALGDGISGRGVYGLTRIFAPLSTYDSVVFHAHSVDA